MLSLYRSTLLWKVEIKSIRGLCLMKTSKVMLTKLETSVKSQTYRVTILLKRLSLSQNQLWPLSKEGIFSPVSKMALVVSLESTPLQALSHEQTSVSTIVCSSQATLSVASSRSHHLRAFAVTVQTNRASLATTTCAHLKCNSTDPNFSRAHSRQMSAAQVQKLKSLKVTS